MSNMMVKQMKTVGIYIDALKTVGGGVGGYIHAPKTFQISLPPLA